MHTVRAKQGRHRADAGWKAVSEACVVARSNRRAGEAGCRYSDGLPSRACRGRPHPTVGEPSAAMAAADAGDGARRFPARGDRLRRGSDAATDRGTDRYRRYVHAAKPAGAEVWSSSSKKGSSPGLLVNIGRLGLQHILEKRRLRLFSAPSRPLLSGERTPPLRPRGPGVKAPGPTLCILWRLRAISFRRRSRACARIAAREAETEV